MVDKMWAVTLPIFIIFAAAKAQNQVPVVIWGNSGASLASPLAGHGLSNAQFISKYVKKAIETKGHNLVAFVQDKLSLEDFAQNADVFNENSEGGAFHNLKDLLSKHSSLHLPSVASPAEAIDRVKKTFKGKVHELTAPYSVKDLDLNPEGNNMIIARLPSMSSNDAVKNIDGVLGSVTSDLSSLGSFTAFYTADQSSKIEGFGTVKTGRQLLEADAEKVTNATFFNVSGCIFFYAHSVKLLVSDKTGQPGKYTTYTLPSTADTDGSSCSNDTGLLLVKYNSAELPEGLKSFSMRMSYKLWAQGYWRMSWLNATFEVNDTKAEGIEYTVDFIWAPLTFSYHCTDPGALRMINPNETQDITTNLEFDALQTQFQVKGDKFGYPNDCVGFFTIPILSGLIVTLVLMLILAFGLGMVANINTMDRFDDPKGKTITVNVAE